MSSQMILTVLAGQESGESYTFSGKALCTIGRSRNCTIRLTGDATVSRHHCVLEFDNRQVKVTDLGSKNGTFVNGMLIGQRDPAKEADCTLLDVGPSLLNSGDHLCVGQSIFLVEIAECASYTAHIDHTESMGHTIRGMLALV